MHKSFRFRTAQTSDLERRLREGLGVAITASSDAAGVVLASEWDHVLGAGLDVIWRPPRRWWRQGFAPAASGCP